MKKNMDPADRMVRLLLAAIFAGMFLANIVTGTLGIALLVLSGVFIVTSLVRFCPLYTLLGINTCPVK